MTRRLVIIPAYNEEPTIGQVVSRLREQLGPQADVLVVDDHSEDRTAIIAWEAGARVERHQENFGYGWALHTGYCLAGREGYDVIAQMDADGQHDEFYVPVLFDTLERTDSDVVTGSRFLEAGLGGTYRAGPVRRAAIAALSAIASAALGQKISDPTTGFQAFHRRVLPLLTSREFPKIYPDADALILIHRHGFRVREIAVPMYAKTRRKSIHGGLRPLKYAALMPPAIIASLMRRPMAPLTK